MRPGTAWMLVGVLVLLATSVKARQAQGQVHVDYREAEHCLLGTDLGATPPQAARATHWVTTAAGAHLDPYHWLRDDNRTNQEVLAHLFAENDYSSSVLRRVQPLHQRLLSEMEERLLDDGETVPARHGNWWYYERSEAAKRHWVTYRRQAYWEQLHAADAPAPGTAEHVQQQVLEDEPFPETSASELAPHPAAPEQVVLDPNAECTAFEPTAEACEVVGRQVSPDGHLVAYGLDASGTESYRMLVRRISDGMSMLDAVLDKTSGDYEWAADSSAVFYVTREPDTNRPYQVWFYRVGSELSDAVLLWHETDPAFYLSLSRSSSGRYLVLSAASEVTRESAALDLLVPSPPTASSWIRLGQRQGGLQQHLSHWQDWFLLLTVAPDTPNGELRAAHVNNPSSSKVLLPHRLEVEMEDVRVFQHHLVIAERQLGHVTLTVYCLPTDSTAGALQRCKFNSTLVSAAGRQEGSMPTPQQGGSQPQQEAQGRQHLAQQSEDIHASMELLKQQDQRDQQAAQAAQQQQGQEGAVQASEEPEADGHQPDAPAARVQGGPTTSTRASASRAPQPQLPTVGLLTAAEAQHLLLIRGRAGTTRDPAPAAAEAAAAGVDADAPGSASSTSAASPPAARRLLAGKPRGQIVISARRLHAPAHVHVDGWHHHHGPHGHQQHKVRLQGLPTSRSSSSSSTGSGVGGSQDGGAWHPAAAASGSRRTDAAPGGVQSQQDLQPASASPSSSAPATAAVGGSSSNAAGVAAAPSEQQPLLLQENSWQVAFEEDSYSVSLVDSGSWSTQVLRIRYSSFTVPDTVVDVQLVTQQQLVRKQRRVGGGFSSSAYRSYRLWARAPDGVQVPISLVYRLNTMQRNTPKPALLMAYGAYGSKYDPEYDSRLFSLLDRGWVVGIAHVRGGGELGRAWHAQGRLDQKPNTFRDLVACAQTLIDLGITSSDRLALWGRSAGGLTVGAALNAAPHLFRAAVLEVPFLDVLNDLTDASLPLTVKEWEEWGDPVHNATMAQLIASYSPVEGVRSQAYPHVLVSAALNDRRVNYWEPAKWVAKLRATKTNDALLLLRTDMTGGHFAGSSPMGSLDAAALQYAFLLATLEPCQVSEGKAAVRAAAWHKAATWVQEQPAVLAGVALLGISLVTCLVVGSAFHYHRTLGYQSLAQDGSSSERGTLGGDEGSSGCCGSSGNGWSAAGRYGAGADLATVAQLEAGAAPSPPQKHRLGPGAGGKEEDSKEGLLAGGGTAGQMGRAHGKPPLPPGRKGRVSSASNRGTMGGHADRHG